MVKAIQSTSAQRAGYNGYGGTGVAGLVLSHAISSPRAPAIRDSSETLDYAELAAQASAMAAGFASLGAKPGDRIVLHMDNSAAFVIAALGCLWIGATFVPASLESPGGRLAETVANCRPIIVLSEVANQLAPLDGGGRNLRPMTPDKVVTLEGSAQVPRIYDPETDAYMIYTSGTTGVPKGVRISGKAFDHSIFTTASLLGLGAQTRALSVSPFQFDGSYGLVWPTLVAGGSLTVPTRSEILFLRPFFDLLLRDEINFSSFSPSYLHLLLSSRHASQLSSSRLSTLLLGGEQCNALDIARLWDLLPSIRVYNRYGPTECTIAVTTYALTREDIAGGAVPIGWPHPGVDFHVMSSDERGRGADGTRPPEISSEPASDMGELYIGGAQLMTGYWGDDELTRQVLRDDVVPGRTVYKTGDLVRWDSLGRYFYAGRLDGVIKRNGIRISLEEVAGAIRRGDGVEGAFCALVNNEGHAEVAALVHASSGVSSALLVEHLSQLLPNNMLPDHIHLVGPFPMTGQGKIDRRRVLKDLGLKEWQA